MGLFGGEKKKRVPNSRKKKGAVSAKKDNPAPVPEQAKPVVQKPVATKVSDPAKVSTSPVSVLDRAKAFNSGTVAKKEDKPASVSVPVGSVSERAKAFSGSNDKQTKATVKSVTEKKESEKKKKFGLFGGKGKKSTSTEKNEKPKVVEKSKAPESTDENKKKFSLFGKEKEATDVVAKKSSNDEEIKTADIALSKPGKLSMAALSINIPGLGGGTRGTDLDSKPAPGKAPPQIDIYADSQTSPDNQEHANMSDEARNKLVAPKETKLGKRDWKFLYELAEQYDAYKVQEAEVSKKKSTVASRKKIIPSTSEPADIKNNLNNIFGGGAGGMANYNANGSFFNNKYFDQYLVQHSSGIALEFSNETGIYKRFNRKDQEQRNISQKFASALAKHPKAKKITQLNMPSALIPDSFLVALCDQCHGFPNLQLLNLESNEIGREGIEALAKCIASPKGFNRLQILKLENQKKEISAGAEEVLGDAIVQSQSLVQVGLLVKGGIPKQQISNTIQANLDKLRLARREHASKKGKLKARKRNEMEVLFDTIASNNNKKLTEVDLTENLRFLGLDTTEVVKAGASFASNKYVTKVTMTKLKLDDDFAEAFGKALAGNKTLETVIMDSNSFSAKGIKALLSGLGQNKSVTNFQIRHQSKTIASSDEECLLELLKQNQTLVNLGIDVRNPLVKTQLERKMDENRELQRKQRNAQKKK